MQENCISCEVPRLPCSSLSFCMQEKHMRLGHVEDSGGFRHREKDTNGSADAQALASAAADGRLAVVTRGKKRRQCLHLYTLQVCLWLIPERSRTACGILA